MNLSGASCFVAGVLLLAAACGGHVSAQSIEGAGAGGGSAGEAAGGSSSAAGSSSAGSSSAGSSSAGSSGVDSGGADSSGVAECPAKSSSPDDYRAIDKKACSNLGAECSPGGCTVSCHCDLTDGQLAWGCADLLCLK